MHSSLNVLLQVTIILDYTYSGSLILLNMTEVSVFSSGLVLWNTVKKKNELHHKIKY